MQTNNPEKLLHTYSYPGDYIVSLEYYLNSYGDVPDASDKMTIKVISTDFLISAVGNEKDFFVELTNNTNYEADISNWILSSNTKNFTFPKNTIIGSKKKMIISPNLTHFSIQDKNTLRLMTPQGKTVFDYGASILIPVVAVPTKTIIQPKSQVSVSPKQINLDENKANSISDLQIPVENLPALVAASDVLKDNPIRAYILAFIFTIFIGASAGAVYFIRQKKTVSQAGDDFKILDE
jgi:hypothetical protein